MATAILLLAIGIVVDIFIIRWERKEAETPFVQEWSFDEGVTAADEVRASALLEKYGKEDPMSLPDSYELHRSTKAFAERYASLEFDDYTMDYNRKELLRGEETEKCWRGFYNIGGDGGEISFYVRKSTDDEKIYAFDMEGSKRPEPYASNIRRFVVMRYNAWKGMQQLPKEEETKNKGKR